MSLSQLLRQTAMRYQAAVQMVLGEWSPECGCHHPGTQPNCEACPCLAEFEQRVRNQIHRKVTQDSRPTSGNCINDP
ncbi:MAG TPA: hypothetical protein V6C65_24325 [Allocoleopsis sp.]